MSEFVLNNSGATITLTNVSTSITFAVENGVISPTLINPNLNETGETPAFSIQVPSFVSYKYNTIQPGDSITFESTNKDEILYYYNISKNPFAGITVTVTPNEGGGGGGGDISAKSVKFIDYNGTLLYAYTPDEFSALSEMPENPIHSGLTSQGWNYSLSDAKSYVADYGALNVGQMYITDDGKTRFYITLTEGRLSPVLGLCPSGTLTIDWGDGTPTETMTGNYSDVLMYLPHTYSTPGDYVVTVTPNSGSTFEFGQRNNMSTIFCQTSSDSVNNRHTYLNILKSVSLGVGVTIIGSYAFNSCYSLTSITIPSSVTTIGINAFGICYSLTSITIPLGIKNIGSSAFSTCYSLTSITIPPSVKYIRGNTFSNCYSLTSVTISSSVTSIEDSTFSGCSSLTLVTIPSSVTSIGKYAFYYCYSLTSIMIPSSVASINSYAFSGCHSLNSIKIPKNVTGINSYTFQYCYSLTSITIPESVSGIGTYAFSYCYGLGFILFNRQTPPSVSSSTAFNNTSNDCIIYAPALVVNLYMNGTNYPNKSTYTYIGFATYNEGETLPNKTSDNTYTLTWYETVEDLKTQTNPITVGNGNEVYAKATKT